MSPAAAFGPGSLVLRVKPFRDIGKWFRESGWGEIWLGIQFWGGQHAPKRPREKAALDMVLLATSLNGERVRAFELRPRAVFASCDDKWAHEALNILLGTFGARQRLQRVSEHTEK